MLAKPGKKQLKLKKVLNGKAPEADKYEFELERLEGNLVDTAKNKADGKHFFKEIEYKGPGLHTYLVSEKAGKEENVTYDTNTTK